MVGDLVDQHHIRGQACADQRVHRRHVRGSEGLDLRQVQGGTGSVDGGHAVGTVEAGPDYRR